MNFQRGKRTEDLEMNLVPLIDVLLVIIIFLIVSATFTKNNELEINLPTAEANESQQKPVSIEVGIDAEGKMTIDGKLLEGSTIAAIEEALKTAVDGRAAPTIIINADAKATHQSVIDVMEASRTAGYTHITFATEAVAQ